ncbi:uncharacterized protein LOC124879374 [Girardinichthys multiradiatus]|uniref:uncharacterized protein LOC124879374 n=1 Tax=Girardinichthys multiradiatus TaxID=208333 RepID=UPI001FABE88F|nr:uncharacterized protein LOC124879374 [Girardinichthys multiradiatus]
MVQSVRGFRYLLVCVDAFTGWPEAWPAKKEDSKTVVKCLINHYIPRHGFPEKIRADNGTHFKNQELQQVESSLGLKHRCSVNSTTGYTPYELETGRSFPGPRGAVLTSTGDIQNLSHKVYFSQLQMVVETYNKVLGSERSTGEPTTPQVEWVWSRVMWLEPKFTGPYQVTERTSHAVRLKDKGNTWFHWSQCAEAPEPGRPLEEIGGNTASSQGAE